MSVNHGSTVKAARDANKFARFTMSRFLGRDGIRLISKRKARAALTLALVGIAISLFIRFQVSTKRGTDDVAVAEVANVLPSASIDSVVSHVSLFTEQLPFPLINPDADDIAFQAWFLQAEAEQVMGKMLQFGVAEEFPPTSSVVIDAGMNRGYFTMLAARLGYDVVSFELSKTCITKALASVKEMKLTAKVDVRQTGLAFADGGFITIDDKCLGGRSIHQSELSESGAIPLLSLSSALSRSLFNPQRQVALLKMDIEGSEYDVLRGFGVEAFIEMKIKNLMVETSSHVWTGEFSLAVNFFSQLASLSSAVYCLDPNLDLKLCKFDRVSDGHLGQLFIVTDMAQALNRTFEYNPNPCCGNLWFRDIGSKYAAAGGLESANKPRERRSTKLSDF